MRSLEDWGHAQGGEEKNADRRFHTDELHRPALASARPRKLEPAFKARAAGNAGVRYWPGYHAFPVGAVLLAV